VQQYGFLKGLQRAPRPVLYTHLFFQNKKRKFRGRHGISEETFHRCLKLIYEWGVFDSVAFTIDYRPPLAYW
jgi:hypothetical protein